MNLSVPQRDYLELLTERPSNKPTMPRNWWRRLRDDNCFDVIGEGVYINDTGREVLERREGGDVR
jgi:hypothetical protein